VPAPARPNRRSTRWTNGSADKYDEGPNKAQHHVSNGLGAQLLAPPAKKHPMDVAFEDPEYQARCAEIDAYFAEKEREWRSKNNL
jgi:hypothetical protein